MDNVAINIDGVLYLRVMDPYKVKVDEISEVNSSINTLYVAGKLWDWRPWVRHHPVGSNNYEERNWKNQSRHAFQGEKRVLRIVHLQDGNAAMITSRRPDVDFLPPEIDGVEWFLIWFEL